MLESILSKLWEGAEVIDMYEILCSPLMTFSLLWAPLYEITPLTALMLPGSGVNAARQKTN